MAKTPVHTITVTRTRRNLGYPESARLVKKAVAAALSAEGVDEPCAVDVTFTDDAHIHALNQQFRDVNRPTDVLSFPLNDLRPGAFDPDDCGWDYDREAIPLGDMVLSLERCAAQAAEYGHSYAHELQYLTVHSVLHLLGYDHVDEGEGKAAMRAREKAVMALLEPERTGGDGA